MMTFILFCSFWGRWGMCENKTQLQYVTEVAEFNKILADPSITVSFTYFMIIFPRFFKNRF